MSFICNYCTLFIGYVWFCYISFKSSNFRLANNQQNDSGGSGEFRRKMMAGGIVFARPAVTGVVSSVGMPRLPVALLFSMPVVSDVPTMASARRFPPRCSGGSKDLTTPCWTSRLSLPVVYSRYKPTRINIDESDRWQVKIILLQGGTRENRFCTH